MHVATSFLTEGFPTTTPDLRFPGQWFQSESGLHQNWMRDYDPTTGRYLQADPLGLVDGASVYGYARQNPGRYVDPRGTCVGPLAIGCIIVGDYIGGLIGGAIVGEIATGTVAAVGVAGVGAIIAGPSATDDGTLGPDAVDDVVGEGGMCPITGDDEFDGECERQLDRNRAICRQLVKPSRKRACYAQAGAVYAACTTGRSQPPFNYP